MPTMYGDQPFLNAVTGQEKKGRVTLPSGETVEAQGLGVAPGTPPPEVGEAPKEQGRPRATDIAGSYRPPTDEEAMARAAEMYGGTPYLASGGGYKAAQVALPGEVETGSKMALGAIQREQQAQQAYLQSPEYQRLMAEQAKAAETEAEAEKGRAAKLKDVGAQREALTKDITAKMEGFRIDPDRLFAQGPTRAVQTFGLGLANIASNIGEAMQGKAGTNAILGLVRDRIAQDIALQEHDYQRMMQGYQVQRNGLMDAVQQIGDERAAAQAVAKQQALVMADKLGQVAQQVGLTDARAARPYLEAQAKILEGLGQTKLHVEQANVQAINQARAQAASSAAHASAVNAQILNQRQQAISSAAAAMRQVPQEDRAVAKDILKTAQEKNLGTQYDLLVRAKEALRDPSVAEAMTSFTRDLVKQLKGSKDSGAIEAAVARMVASEGLTPSQRAAADLFREFSATKMVGLGGKSLTATEQLLYDPFLTVGERADIHRVVDQQMENLQSQKQNLFHQGGFSPDSPSGAYLANALSAFVPSDLQRQAAPPPPQKQPSEIAK